MAEDAPTPFDPVRPNPLGTVKGYDPYDSGRLARSAADLAAALEKMRIANAKLALRMAEHKAFFAKYQRPE